jgi:hypothetical protein
VRFSLERLPDLLDRKLYKTGQTRGATTREIYQNRVNRNSTVLIPLDQWDLCRTPDDGSTEYENGFIVLVPPAWYFRTQDADQILSDLGLMLGVNAVLLFQRRAEWAAYAPANGVLPNGMTFNVPSSRLAPIGGTYMARVHSTTATANSGAIVQGFDDTSLRGAGIRIYEYASTDSLNATRLQLEALFWHCHNATEAVTATGMTEQGAVSRRLTQLTRAQTLGYLDYERLFNARMIDDQHRTICPLCLQLIDADDFMQRGAQAEGRETYDNTITEVSLFHIEELRVGKLQHKPYNLGWGHHFCNVVVKDAGIIPTLKWMKMVLDQNGNSDEAIAAAEALVEQAVEL